MQLHLQWRKSSNQNYLDMIFSPHIEVNKDPSFHKPYSFWITFFNRLNHSIGAWPQILWFHRFRLRVKNTALSNIHLHEQITIIEMWCVSVVFRFVKNSIISENRDISELWWTLLRSSWTSDRPVPTESTTFNSSLSYYMTVRSFPVGPWGRNGIWHIGIKSLGWIRNNESTMNSSGTYPANAGRTGNIPRETSLSTIYIHMNRDVLLAYSTPARASRKWGTKDLPTA